MKTKRTRGLGVEVPELKNKCQLSKWFYKHGEGVWHELIQNKYLHSKMLSEIKSNAFDSPFWKCLMRVKDDFISRGHFEVGNGVHNIVRRKEVSVADVMSCNPLNIVFRRALTENKWTSWLHLVRRLMDIQLTNDQHSFVWNLTPSGVFSVKSMYLTT
jgi:hypothetical protein